MSETPSPSHPPNVSMSSPFGIVCLQVFNDIAHTAAQIEGLPVGEYIDRHVTELGNEISKRMDGVDVNVAFLVCVGILLQIEKASEISCLAGMPLDEAFKTLEQRKKPNKDGSHGFGRG